MNDTSKVHIVARAERAMEVSYWEHEQLYFPLLDGLLDAVRKNGVWVRPDNTVYLGIDVRTYGSRISQAEAEAEGH